MSKHINDMKNLLPKFVMTVLVALISLNANAYDVYIDGIYYNLVGKAKTAEVTSGDNKYKGEIIIPSSFEKDGIVYSITSIDNNAFEDCSGLTFVKIPNSVTKIGDSAFSGCI